MAQLILNTMREGYGTDQVKETMTAGELIRLLEDYDEDTKIYLAFDSRYTYGGILEQRFEEEDDEENEDE